MGNIFSRRSDSNQSFFNWIRRRSSPEQQYQPGVSNGPSHLDLSSIAVDDSMLDVTLRSNQSKGVKSLTLRDNDQIKEIPRPIGYFENLEILDLRQNDIENISWAIVYLKKLKVLNLANNRLTELPRVIGHLVELKELYIQGNNLSRLPVELLKLTKLKTIDLSNNKTLNEIFPGGTSVSKVFATLSKTSKRHDMWKEATPWVTEDGHPFSRTTEVPSLHDLCVESIMTCKIDFLAPQFIPPVVKNNLTEIETIYQNRLNVAKCSYCKKYFSTKHKFDNHLC